MERSPPGSSGERCARESSPAATLTWLSRLRAARGRARRLAQAMFTTNRVVAAPVTVGRRHLAATGGRVAAVLVNSGNANCANGEPGIGAASPPASPLRRASAASSTRSFPPPPESSACPFPADKVVAAIRELKASVGSSEQHAEAFVRAMMTRHPRQDGPRGRPGRIGRSGPGRGNVPRCASGARPREPE